MTYFVYKLTSPSNKAYIGITGKSVTARWNCHVRDAKKGAPFLLHKAMRKHGHENFKIETLCECVNAMEAKVCERAMVAEHGTFFASGNGYNLTLGGEGNHGWKMRDETRRKIGEKSKGRIPSAESRAKMSAAGKGKKRPKSPEHLAKIGAKLKGRIMSPEWRAKIAAAGVGRVKSPETIQKLKDARKNYRPSAESVAKMRATKTGQKMKPEHAAAAAARLAEIRARPLTDDQRKAMSDRRKAYLAIPENQARHREMMVARNKSMVWTEDMRSMVSEQKKAQAVARTRNASGAFVREVA